MLVSLCPDMRGLTCRSKSDNTFFRRFSALSRLFPSICTFRDVLQRVRQTLTDFSRLDDWGDLLILTGQVNFDHLLVIISARRGSISYDSSFEKLPAQISKYFANNSLIVLYPDQLGEPQDAVSFSNPRGNNESQHYEKVGKWFYKWFKKN